jgi:hypothetical protein
MGKVTPSSDGDNVLQYVIIETDCPKWGSGILRDVQYGQLVLVGHAAFLAQAIAAAPARTMPRLPSEGWKPFELEAAVDQYVSTLLGS